MNMIYFNWDYDFLMNSGANIGYLFYKKMIREES